VALYRGANLIFSPFKKSETYLKRDQNPTFPSWFSKSM
jgi:hypothetical protein